MKLLVSEFVQGWSAGRVLFTGQCFIPETFRVVVSVFVISVVILLAYLFYKSELARTRRELVKNKIRLEELSRKLAILEYRSSNITDSLVNAQRIQNALLPDESLLIENFTESLILYLPKDIVSGDFYWFYKNHNKVFLVVADCTGHGVPGALMSMIAHNLINNLIRENPEDRPGDILDRLDKMVRSLFPVKPGGPGIKESMDITVCAINPEELSLEFSGAFSSVYYFSDNKLYELKGDKYILGMKPSEASYSTYRINLEKGDPVYLFTDGYADQFGGEENKKFMYRRLRYLLTTINRLPMSEQKIILTDTLENWKGDNDQIDDILVIGIRI
ncbi:MAG: serine/threonine-protein phosphatase [Bacteroidales bacterium]|nr:serine/threonine-protein phosphatase [Bacteroidales bacterium]